MSVRDFFMSSGSMQSILQEDRDETFPPKTKIACTLGPNTQDVNTLEQMLDAGMVVARIDFSSGTKEFHQTSVDNLQRAMRHTKYLCALMLDTCGPEVQVVNRGEENPIAINVKAGETITLTCDKSKTASDTSLPISCDSLEGWDIKEGDEVFIGQYLFTGSDTTSGYATVKKVTASSIECVCRNSAVLDGPRLMVHLPGAIGSQPILSQYDIDVISTWGKENRVHFICLSLVRSPDDVKFCRDILDNVGLSSTKILAKIETKAGLANFEPILDVADGIILSRGCLGIEIEAETMFRVQKTVLQVCNEKGKPVVVTRVVDTMTDNPRPTRAEATDVANLVLDGADCIMLGAETYRGKYPVTAVKTVARCAIQAEKAFDSEAYYQSLVEDKVGSEGAWKASKVEGLASSAVRAAAKLDAALLIVFTITGNTARMVAKYRPPMPILSVVFPRVRADRLKWTFTGEAESRQILVSRGVVPLLADPNLGGTQDGGGLEGSMLSRAIAYAWNKHWVKLGDRIVISQCPRQNNDWDFTETGVVKIVVLTKEVLESAINVYNMHHLSVSSSTVKNLFRYVPRAQTFKGKPINALPAILNYEGEDGVDPFDITAPQNSSSPEDAVLGTTTKIEEVSEEQDDSIDQSEGSDFEIPKQSAVPRAVGEGVEVKKPPKGSKGLAGFFQGVMPLRLVRKSGQKKTRSSDDETASQDWSTQSEHQESNATSTVRQENRVAVLDKLEESPLDCLQHENREELQGNLEECRLSTAKQENSGDGQDRWESSPFNAPGQRNEGGLQDELDGFPLSVVIQENREDLLDKLENSPFGGPMMPPPMDDGFPEASSPVHARKDSSKRSSRVLSGTRSRGSLIRMNTGSSLTQTGSYTFISSMVPGNLENNQKARNRFRAKLMNIIPGKKWRKIGKERN